MAKLEPGRQRTGGRKKGTPNKITALLRDEIQQAQENPTAFLTLLGKVLPMQVQGTDGGPLQVVIQRFSKED